jgi:hypothetical protein
MVWVIVFGGIGLAGLIMLICYAVWLAHKASDLFSELDMLATRADELAELVAQINVPEPTFQPDWRSNRPTVALSAEIDQASAT